MSAQDKQAGAAVLGTVLATVRDAVSWLDAYRPVDEREITMRLLKVTEEAGEAAQAWIGATGQNPRKGITHSRAEVAAELADVVVAALVAVASLDMDPAAVLGAKAAALRERLDGCARLGHDLADDGWRMCACGRSLPDHADTPPDPVGGDGCGMTWRACSRCEFVDEHHVTEHDDHAHGTADERGEQDQPGGHIRQEATAGLALPNHHQATEETMIVEPSTVGGDRR
jgi:NTP pyrophosphatase (non-canonical NTP hydrolase)